MAAFFKGGKVLRVVSGVVRSGQFQQQHQHQQQQQQHQQQQQQNGSGFKGAEINSQIWNWEMLQNALPTSTFASVQQQPQQQQQQQQLKAEHVTKEEIMTLAEDGQGVLALRLCGKALECEVKEAKDRVTFMHSVMTKMEEMKAQIGSQHYNSILQVYKELQFEYNPEFMLARINNAKVSPDSQTFHLLLEAYLEDGNVEGALKLVQVISVCTHLCKSAIFLPLSV